MDFIRFSFPSWLALLLGAAIALIVPLIPDAKPGLGYVLGIIFWECGFLAMWAFWKEWHEQKIKRNTYTIEPFKKRLERYRNRHQLN